MMQWLGTIPLHSFSKNKTISSKDNCTVKKPEETVQIKTELVDIVSTETTTCKNV